MMLFQNSRSLCNTYASRLFRCNFNRCISYARQSNQIHLTNFGNVFYVVPEQVACIVERFGKFQRILHPGLHFLIPFVDRVSYTHSLKEETIAIKDQSAITKDNVNFFFPDCFRGITLITLFTFRSQYN
jgi:hypothetical protein